MSTPGHTGLQPDEDQYLTHLHAWLERHQDVFITAPGTTVTGQELPWRAERFGAEITRAGHLGAFVARLHELGLPETFVSES